MKVGDRVIDVEAEDPGLAVVINKPNMTTSNWQVTDDETVADLNPRYSSHDAVVLVAFEDDLDEWWPEWREEDEDEIFDEMKQRSHKFYAFPETRLRVVDEDFTLTSVEKIANALDDAGYEDYEEHEDRVVVEKFGEYTITEDGEVEGEGALKKPLERVVRDVDLSSTA
ncbi:MAG: hypothetical protein ACLFMT_06225 [Halobacteriales archaeon]